MAAVRIDAELIDDFEVVLAPVLDIDEDVVERRAIIADKRFPVPQRACGGVHVGVTISSKKSLEFVVGEVDAVECFEFLPEFASSLERSRMSGRCSYLRSLSFVTRNSSRLCSDVIVGIVGTHSLFTAPRRG